MYIIGGIVMDSYKKEVKHVYQFIMIIWGRIHERS